MDIAVWIIGTISFASLLWTVLLTREFFSVTRKRREFMASLGKTGRAVPTLKHTLVVTYILTSVGWTAGLVLYYFFVVQ